MRAMRGLLWRSVPALAFVTALSGCLTIETPPSFVVTKRGLYEFHAVTPDATRLLVRDISVEHEASLEFWVRTIRNDFVANRGYTLIEERAIEDARGRPGHELLFEVSMGGTAWRYLLAVSLRKGLFCPRVRSVELVGEKHVFDEYVAEVRSALTPRG